MEFLKIAVEAREKSGKGSKGANNSLRKEGKIPAVLYGGSENVLFTTTFGAVKKLIYTPDFKMAELEMNGKLQKAILKEVQFHPVTDEILHLDFLRLQDGVKINLEIPVKCVGESPGIIAGGSLMQSLRKIKIKTTPDNILDELTVDISGVELGGAIRVKDIVVSDEVEILNSPNIPIATVEVPRALKSAEAEEEEAAEGAEAAPAEGAAPAAE